MRRLSKVYGIWMTGALLACSACAEDLVFFESSTAGADAWSWGGAKVTPDNDLLVIAENNDQAAYGDAYPSDILPYLPGARLEFNVNSVLVGSYTLQILCFRGNVNFKSVDIIKDSMKTGPQTFKMGELMLPPETQSIMIKLWVANKEGASLKLKELKYSMPVAEGSILFDERFKDISAWTPTDLDAGGTDAGLSLGTIPDKSYGCLSTDRKLPVNKQSSVLIDVIAAQSSVVTVQLELLDSNNQFLKAVDAVKDVGIGWHGSSLALLDIPAEATQYQLKIWMSGGTAAKARVARLIVLN